MNRSDSHRITINGETHCLACWCRFFGQNYNLVIERINRLNWEPLRALKQPSRQTHRRKQQKGQ